MNGRMERQYKILEEEGGRLITYFKYLAIMDVGEKRRPQSGSLIYSVGEDQVQDLRLSTISNYHNKESLVIRLLEVKEEVYLEKSTLFQEELRLMKRLVLLRSGLILFSGPVNSGKTTPMYQLVRDRMRHNQLQVITIEDPVEIEEEKFLQIQVNEKAGNTYEASLKASLRHHPDIIIVGEIRDEETARMAIRGALTGHLIIASIHAKNAEGVLSRMNELGISNDMLRQTVVAIVFQKLLPLYCFLCDGPCGIYCPKFPVKQKRASLYDVLTSGNIRTESSPDHINPSYFSDRNFNCLLQKVCSYGFISEDTYYQYFIP